MLGDELFDTSFPVKDSQFTLTQNWDAPMNTASTSGNLLFHFYDHPLCTNFLGGRPRIETRAVWNHPDYLKLYSGGMDQLHNCTRINGENIIFQLGAANILSDADLEKSFIIACNAPRDLADFDTLWLWNFIPAYVHPHFEPKTFGILAREAEASKNRLVDETAWNSSRLAEEQGTAYNFQFLETKGMSSRS